MCRCPRCTPAHRSIRHFHCRFRLAGGMLVRMRHLCSPARSSMGCPSRSCRRYSRRRQCMCRFHCCRPALRSTFRPRHSHCRSARRSCILFLLFCMVASCMPERGWCRTSQGSIRCSVRIHHPVQGRLPLRTCLRCMHTPRSTFRRRRSCCLAARRPRICLLCRILRSNRRFHCRPRFPACRWHLHCTCRCCTQILRSSWFLRRCSCPLRQSSPACR